jgi:hypothetical protein
LRQIEIESNTTISIPPLEYGGDKISITGLLEATEQACAKLTEHIQLVYEYTISWSKEWENLCKTEEYSAMVKRLATEFQVVVEQFEIEALVEEMSTSVEGKEQDNSESQVKNASVAQVLFKYKKRHEKMLLPAVNAYVEFLAGQKVCHLHS